MIIVISFQFQLSWQVAIYDKRNLVSQIKPSYNIHVLASYNSLTLSLAAWLASWPTNYPISVVTNKHKVNHN